MELDSGTCKNFSQWQVTAMLLAGRVIVIWVGILTSKGCSSRKALISKRPEAMSPCCAQQLDISCALSALCKFFMCDRFT